MGLESGQLSQAVVDELSSRLAASADLRLPGQLTKAGSEPPSENKRKEYLSALLLRDPGVFLERHGEMLSLEDRAAFEPLRGDYEVDFYLKLLEDREDSQKQGTAAKNRRLAYMNRLLQEGTFFSDEAMKDRQPYLHHQYVGQFTPPGEAGPKGGAAPAQPGGSGADGPGVGGVPLSQSLLRHQDELEAMLARRAEQERYDRMEEESESESESESGSEQEEEEAAGAGPGAAAGGGDTAAGQGRQPAAAGWRPPGAGSRRGVGGGSAGGPQEQEEEGDPGYVVISDAERHENAETFLDLMKERFLRGEEVGVDYHAIDADASLDDDWLDQRGQDAEDAYFDKD